MPTNSLGRRLDRLRRTQEEDSGFVVILPESWPSKILAAYDAASATGDQQRRADIVESQTGKRPVFPPIGAGANCGRRTPPIVEIRSRPDGPQ